MHRLFLLLVIVMGCAGVAEEAAAPVPQAAKAEPVAGPRPAKVVFVGGIKIEKCWVEEKQEGVWIIAEGKRYWYLRGHIQAITWLEGEPDKELKEWLAEAEKARRPGTGAMEPTSGQLREAWPIPRKPRP